MLKEEERKIFRSGPQIHMHKECYRFYFYLVPIKLCVENTFSSLLELSVDSSSPWLRSRTKYFYLLRHLVCVTVQGGSCSR